jgi:hypothetical protein
MTRTIQDRDLQLWEAYASAGGTGTPERSRIVFQCLSDPGRRARALLRDAANGEVEREIATLPEAALVDLLADAEELK